MTQLLLSITLLIISAIGLYHGLWGFRWLWLLPFLASIALLWPWVYGLLLSFDRRTPMEKIDAIHREWAEKNPNHPALQSRPSNKSLNATPTAAPVGEDASRKE